MTNTLLFFFFGMKYLSIFDIQNPGVFALDGSPPHAKMHEKILEKEFSFVLQYGSNKHLIHKIQEMGTLLNV